jgi:leucyl-tRNA synthetase
VFTGGHAINPVNGEKLPIWIADYVLMGTAPARSWRCPGTTRATGRSRALSTCRFAKWSRAATSTREAYVDLEHGMAVNSTTPDGTLLDRRTQAAPAIARSPRGWSAGEGRRAINYKLRDWLFSRQRYWGEPFPLVWAEGGRRRSPSSSSGARCPRSSSSSPSHRRESAEARSARLTDWVRPPIRLSEAGAA